MQSAGGVVEALFGENIQVHRVGQQSGSWRDRVQCMAGVEAQPGGRSFNCLQAAGDSCQAFSGSRSTQIDHHTRFLSSQMLPWNILI